MSSKAPDPVPADEVPQWPLLLGLCMLALSAFLSARLGRIEAALVLICAAVLLPLVGMVLRSYLGVGRPQPPRIRRVVVTEDNSTIVTVTLETAKYLTPPEQPGLPAPDEPVTSA